MQTLLCDLSLTAIFVLLLIFELLYFHFFDQVVEAFVAAVRSPAHRPAVTGQHGLNALRIAEQITRQIAEA